MRLRKFPESSAYVVQTGIGLEQAAESMRRLFDALDVSRLLVVGFGGGLREGSECGDTLIANDVVSQDGSEAVSGDRELTERLLQTLQGSERRFLPGRLVSLREIVATPDAKRSLATERDADVADMESLAIAKAAAEAGVPTVITRTIVDDVDLELRPEIGTLMGPDGNLRPWNVAKVLWKPKVLKDLLELGRRSDRAAESIAEVATAFLRLQS
ncbi:MAG: hypothetical protein AAF488_07640 [Planctomycetota bacterium]